LRSPPISRVDSPSRLAKNLALLTRNDSVFASR
jgi:hypothetical protein